MQGCHIGRLEEIGRPKLTRRTNKHVRHIGRSLWTFFKIPQICSNMLKYTRIFPYQTNKRLIGRAAQTDVLTHEQPCLSIFKDIYSVAQCISNVHIVYFWYISMYL
jgi:hypothetical protein